MPNDPNLSTDNSLFMEANTGDGGTHAGTWWLSPDVTLPGDIATAGSSNKISLRVHKNANPAPANTGDVFIEVWVAAPALIMAPNVSSVLIGTQPVPLASLAGGAATTTLNWTPAGAAGAPDAPGHRCLIARCFSDQMSPDAASFYVPEDPHYVQHNITVVAAAPGVNKKIFISTGNGEKTEHQATTIQAIEDVRPNRFVQATALNALQKVKGFQRFATTPSRSFAVDVTRFDRQIAAQQRAGVAIADVLRPGVNLATVLQPGITTTMLTPGLALKSLMKSGVSLKSVVKASVPEAILTGAKLEAGAVTLNLKKDSTTGLFGRLANPNVTAKINLPPKTFNTFEFTVDLSKSKPGTAHIYHLTHTGADRKAHGGLTVVVAVK